MAIFGKLSSVPLIILSYAEIFLPPWVSYWLKGMCISKFTENPSYLLPILKQNFGLSGLPLDPNFSSLLCQQYKNENRILGNWNLPQLILIVFCPVLWCFNHTIYFNHESAIFS